MAAAVEAAGASDRVAVTGSLRRGEGDLKRFLASLAEAHTHGVDVDWGCLFEGARVVDLPTYAFQRERFWIEGGRGAGDLGAVGLLDAEHPLLGAAVRLAASEEWLFTGSISLNTHPWLKDHAVAGVVLVPGMLFVELAFCVARRLGVGVVDDLTLVAPLVVGEGGGVALQVVVSDADEQGRRPVNVYSCSQGPLSLGEFERRDWVLHASGLLGGDGGALEDLGLAGWPPVGARECDVESFYERAADAGYEYGPAFQGLRRAYRDGDVWHAEVALGEDERGGAGGFCVHPALSDAALHVMLLAALEDGGLDGSPQVPFSFSGVRLFSEGASALRVRLEISPGVEGEGSSVRVVAVDESGMLVFVVNGLRSRAIDQAALRVQVGAGQDVLFAVDWVEVQDAAPGGGSSRVVSLGRAGLGGWADELECFESLGALSDAITAGETQPDVVLAPVVGRAGGQDVARAAHELTEWTLLLLQRWVQSEALAQARLVFLTDAALALAEDESPNLAQTALVGLVRSAASENPGRVSLIDLDTTDASRQALQNTLTSQEPEIALRNGTPHTPRLTPAGSSAPLIPPLGEDTWKLATKRPGTLEDLALMPNPQAQAPLRPGQLRIAVHAAGLNFRDVLIALGRYPGAIELGGEGAGVVQEIAPDVQGFEPGDRVTGLMTGAFGPLATTDARLVTKIPDEWSYAEAASVPTTFLTSYYGLVDLAKLKRGERLLVQAATGGVGMAAMQLAAHLGAEVFATASPSKWETLAQLGLEESHIASSRSAEFSEKFLQGTEGEGVDVVFNSLTGDLVDASLALLPRGGRFIEIGKADLRDRVRVAAEHPGVAYQAFDLLEAGPERIQAMLGELMALFAASALSPLPVSTWDVRRAPEAFRQMREGQHVGKIVLTLAGGFGGGTVLVTGGTGGLGVLVARHLAGVHGVRRLVLVSRGGGGVDGVGELVASLAELGCEARVVACDVANRAQLEGVLGEVDAEYPLTGVVHAAGVLDDGVVGSLDGERLKGVMAPKVDGAVNLHELTKGLSLSRFVLFSSIASTLGAPGQGNYAAANAFLDGLAHVRRAEGLPAVSIAWGAWERGMVSALDRSDRARGARSGVVAFSDEQGLDLFDVACVAARPVLVPVRLDLAALRARARDGTLPVLLSGLARVSARRVAEGSLAQRLAGVPQSQWQEVVLEIVKAHVAGVLGHSSSAPIDSQRPFKDLGFDSLSGVELRNRLSQATGLELPTTLTFDYTNPTAVTQHLIRTAAPSARSTEDASEEGQLRELFASIPLRRLRQAGLLDPLLDLARPDADGKEHDENQIEVSVDEMDADELIRATLGEVGTL